jgi:cysteine desulfurase
MVRSPATFPLPDVPIVMLTGHGERSRVIEAIKIGVNEYLLKPVSAKALRDRLEAGLFAAVPQIKLNGHPTERLPNTLNVSFAWIEGESLLMSLDMKGIAASSGSACTSGSLEPSHVLGAMCVEVTLAHSSTRFSLGANNTAEEIDYVIEILPPIVQRLRDMSPLYNCRDRETCTVGCGTLQKL